MGLEPEKKEVSKKNIYDEPTQIILLKGKFSKKIFGMQFIFKKYTIQCAYKKLEIYNSKLCKWLKII